MCELKVCRESSKQQERIKKKKEEEEDKKKDRYLDVGSNLQALRS